MTHTKEMKIIGITGGIGAGKTELLEYIRAHYSCEIYLADKVAHEVEKKGTACYEKLVLLLGKEVLSPDGEIDKQEMAKRIFLDPGLLERVNALVHPAVREYLLSQMERAKREQKTELFFVEAALLIECGYRELVDELWYVYADRQVRIDRLTKNRGYSTEKIESIMGRQLSEEEFLAACTFRIDNSKSLEESYRQINEKLEGHTWYS